MEPLPEKLKSVRNMPPPANTREIEWFPGLVGYYRKLILHTADAARPLTNLTRKDIVFEWITISRCF